MVVAVLLQIVAAADFVVGAVLFSYNAGHSRVWAAVGGGMLAAAVVVFVVGWSLEQRHDG